MDHPRSTSVETLGDLVAHGYGLNAMCEACRRRANLDTHALIAKLGASFRFIRRTLDGRLVCTVRGARDVAVQLHCLDAARSRLAD